MRSQKNNVAIMMGAAVVFVCVALAVSISAAQVQTTTTTSAGAASKTVKVEQGEVVYVSGNDLVVKMADGSLRHFRNVPDSARVTVDGKQLGIHDLRVGMKLQRTITTTTVPETIKTVQTVTGTVWNVNPPGSVILTLEDGKNQQFKIPKGQKFDVDGQMTDAWGLRKGMKLTATKIVETPTEVVTKQAKVTGTMPAPPPPPPDAPILVVEEMVAVPVETAQAAPTTGQPATLPKTGSPVPLIGLLGLIFLASSLGLKAFRAR
jgi:LPXTG-motif cell wall-anchored protein